MPLDNKQPTLDISKIKLPTDKVTVGQIRQRQPELFDSERIADLTLLHLDVIGIADLEIALAEKAFAATLKQPDPRPADDPRDLVQTLDSEYRAWGISSGMQNTRELVRGFQAAAVQQAKSIRGSSR